MNDPNRRDFLSIREAAEKIGISKLVGLNTYKAHFIARSQFLPFNPEPGMGPSLQVSKYPRKMDNPIQLIRCFDA